jgi:ATP-grasp domain, R2K clade family 2
MKLYLEISKEHGTYLHDFVFEAASAAIGENWFRQEEAYQIIPTTIDDVQTHTDAEGIYIGSVEFVGASLNGWLPKPMNIPKCLEASAKRKLYYDVKPHELVDTAPFPIFVKEAENIKAIDAIVLYNKTHAANFAMDNYRNTFFVSEFIPDISGEFRVFCRGRKIIDIRQYSGDYKCLLTKEHIEEIERMVAIAQTGFDYDTCRTLDVAVAKDVVYPIEMHQYFSCGTYGFGGTGHLRMSILAYRELKKQQNKAHTST